MIAVDLNRDGLIDLVFANSGANQVYFNQGGGTYPAPVMLGLADSRVYFSAGPDHMDTDASRDTAPEEDTPVTVITVTETSGTNDGTPTTTEVIVVRSGSLSGLLALLGIFLLWTRRADGLQVARAQRIDH